MLAKKKENVSRSAAALTSKTPFQIVEAYKAIRANLLFMLSTAAEKAVVVTSAEPSAGKSTTCSNLAITMAQTGAKVVIVDADMRKPVLHKIFRVSNNNGLSKLLSGLIKPEDCINKSIMPNLDLINAGPIPPNPPSCWVRSAWRPATDPVRLLRLHFSGCAAHQRGGGFLDVSG